jgi:predicted alpha/beta hydrolase family esterase
LLIVPGLRDAVAQHWQTLLAEGRRDVACVPPMGRSDLDCQARLDAIERAAQAVAGPLVIVAHSGGCIMVAHWARQTRRPVQAALLATPPDFDTALPEGYPTLAALGAGGWFPVPRQRLPFPALVAASRNDPLGRFERVAALARDWGARLTDLGEVGHLNPASGFGPWADAPRLIAQAIALSSQPA